MGCRDGRACLLLLASLLAAPAATAAAPDLVPDPRFRSAARAGDRLVPAFFAGLHDRPSLDPVGADEAPVLVPRPPGSGLLVAAAADGSGVVALSPPLPARPGHAYLLVVAWDPRLGPAEAAFLARAPAGDLLPAASLRLSLLADGQAAVGPLVLGSSAAEPFLFPAARGPLEPIEVRAAPDHLVALVRLGPLPPAVAQGEIALGHGPESSRALFVRASLLDLGAGTVLVRGRGAAPALAVAPAGVILDPARPPRFDPVVDEVEIEAAPGERRELAVAFLQAPSRPAGGVELRAERLLRREVPLDDPTARGAAIGPAALSLWQQPSPAVTRHDLVLPAGERQLADLGLRLSLVVPEGTPAGSYRGRITLTAPGLPGAELPLGVAVRGPALSGNRLLEPGFERSDGLSPVGWRVSGMPPGRRAAADEAARSGARSLLLAWEREAVTPLSASALATAGGEGPHRLSIHLRFEGPPAPVEVELGGPGGPGEGRLRVEAQVEGPRLVARIAAAEGLREAELEEEGDGWWRLTAVAELGGGELPLTVSVRAAGSPEAGALRLDDVALVPLRTGFEEVAAEESLVRDPGFEEVRDDEPPSPRHWPAVVIGAGSGEVSVPRRPLSIDGPVRSGRRALVLAAGDDEEEGGPGSGLEVRSSRFAVARGDRLLASFHLRPSGRGAALRAALRCFDGTGKLVAAETAVDLRAGPPGALAVTPGAAVRATAAAADERGFHAVRIRYLDLPEEAVTAALALLVAEGAAAGSFTVVDDARVRPVRPPWVTAGLDLDGYARWSRIRLWDETTDPAFAPLFGALAGLGLKPDVPTPESFADLRRPFPSTPPPLLAPALAERFAAWGGWWWRQGLVAGALAPPGEELPRALDDFYRVWMPPLRARDLAHLAWAASPVARPCGDDPRSLTRHEGWARAVAAAAPELRRLAAPCPEMDARGRRALVGLVDIWQLPLVDLVAGELPGPTALSERRELGELLWADLGPHLARLDAAPARPRAALWGAWHLGFDGAVAAGLTRWEEAGLGRSIDGGYTLDPGARLAPGVLLWPLAGHRLAPSARLLELGQGLSDLRLLKKLEETLAVGRSRLTDLDREGEGEGEAAARTRLDAAVAAAARAIARAHAVAGSPPEEAGTAEIEAARGEALAALVGLAGEIDSAR